MPARRGEHAAAAFPATRLTAVAAGHRETVVRGGMLTLIATVLGSSLSFIDGSVVNVALPAIGGNLHANAGAVQWIVNAYLLPLSALVLLGGALSDRFGRKRLFLAGVALFALASMASVFAPNIELLHASRALQGLGSAMFVPASLAILGTDFEGEARGRAIGSWAAAGAVAGAAGPILGGFLVDTVGWRAIFAINVPIAVAALVMGWIGIAPSTADGKGADTRVDWTGAVLATFALGAMTWGLTRLSGAGMHSGAIALSIAIVFGVGFWFAERRAGDKAMVPFALFGTRTFSGITVLTLLLYGALAALLLLLPYLLISHGWRASSAGMTLLPISILMASGSRFAGRLAERIGARPMLATGPVVISFGFAWFTRLPDTGIDYWRDVLPAMALIGAGLTICVAPLTTVMMTAVDSKHAGAASGVNNATARIGGMIATALVGLALTEGGRNVSVDAFHNAAWVAAVIALGSGATSWWLIDAKAKG